MDGVIVIDQNITECKTKYEARRFLKNRNKNSIVSIFSFSYFVLSYQVSYILRLRRIQAYPAAAPAVMIPSTSGPDPVVEGTLESCPGSTVPCGNPLLYPLATPPGPPMPFRKGNSMTVAGR